MRNSAKKDKQGLHFKLLFVGLFFLANPSFTLFDILPNSLASLFIMLSLRHLPQSLLYFREVREGFLRLFWVSLSKLLAGFCALTIMGGNTAERGILAVFGFVYFILELLFLYPAFRDLFHATNYLDERFGISSCGGMQGKKGYYPAETLLSLTYVFFAVRGILSFLPECMFLSSYDAVTGEGASAYMISRLYFPTLVLCQVIGFVFMAIWLTKIIRYFIGIRDNPDFRILLETEAAKVDDSVRKKEHSRTLFALAFFCLPLAVGLNIDLVFDGVGVLPDFLSCFFFVLFLLLLSRFMDKRLSVFSLWVGGLAFLSSLLLYIGETLFANNYEASDLGRVIAADQLHFGILTLSAIHAVLFSLLTVLVAVSLYRLMKLRIGAPKDPLSYEGRRAAGMCRYYRRHTTVFAALGILDAAASAFHVFLRGYTERLPASEEHLGVTTVILEKFGWFWLLCLAFSFLWLIYTLYLQSQIEVEWKEAFEE